MEQNISKRIEALEEALKDPDEGVRQKAAESLSRIEAKADFDTYILMLDSDDRATRIQAIYHLAELATQPAIELLRLQIRDPYDDVRAAVVQALGESSNNYTIREIRQEAVDIALMGLEDVNLSIRASAADTLAKFKDPRSARALLALITTGTKDESEDAQPAVSALLALGEIGGTKVVPEIIEKAKVDNLQIREAALKILGMLRDPRAEDCLVEALTSDDARIRMQAAESLGYIDFGF
jgi:HEAT repeat protein